MTNPNKYGAAAGGVAKASADVFDDQWRSGVRDSDPRRLLLPYTALYHAANNALIHGTTAPARAAVSRLLRSYRRQGKRREAVLFADHAANIGWPLRKRANGRWR